MWNFVITLLASAAVSSALTGLLLWLVKSWIGERLKNAIKHEYDTKLESHKAQLKAEVDIAAERLRADLQVAATASQIRFEKLHGRVVRTLAIVYRNLYRGRYAVSNYTRIIEYSSQPPRAERREAVREAMNAFEVHFQENKVYIPRETARKIDEFATKLHSTAAEFMDRVEHGETPGDDAKTWTKVHRIMSNEVPPLFDALTTEIQDILGFKKP